MTFYVQDREQQKKLADAKLKQLLQLEHGVQNKAFDPLDYESLCDFEFYFAELNELGLC